MEQKKIKDLADKIWNETIGKEELMYNPNTNPIVHPKNSLCDAMGCIKYDEKVHGK